MAILLSEAITTLLSGKELKWAKYAEHKAGHVTLNLPAQRRLIEYLLGQDSKKVAQGDETLFPGIIDAWNNDEHDPANEDTAEKLDNRNESWRLERIEASGFGGLTQFGGKPFDLWISGNNWCLEGQNGSGKTSLASAILWTLTGKRIRDQDGPIEDNCTYAPIYDGNGREIGQWPPMVSYPIQISDLKKTAEVWVRLTFKNSNNDIASAYRRVYCLATGTPAITVEIDERLVSTPQLIETGLLMPARLTKVGFGEKSQSLYEAVKLLTGLDQLADIADGCGVLTHAGRRFLKYGKDHGIDTHKNKYDDKIQAATQLAATLSVDLPKDIEINHKDAIVNLQTAASDFSSQAGRQLEVLKSEIAETIDTTTSGGRERVKKAVETARAYANQKTRGIAVFEAWAALKDAADNQEFKKLSGSINSARVTLATAISWHNKQQADTKFRLKALAAQSYIMPHEHNENTDCPLCLSALSTEEQKKLAVELAELKNQAVSAERKIDDVCRSIESELTAHLPSAIKQHRDMLVTMDPKESFSVAVLQRFSEDSPFSDVLTGVAGCAKRIVAAQKAMLPQFAYSQLQNDEHEPESAQNLRRTIHSLERLDALVTWWGNNREIFVNAWSTVLGKKQDDGTFDTESIEGQLAILEQALAKAEPLDALSKHLTVAADAAAKWAVINKEQELREKIAKALEPLKELRNLVGAETASSIARLSSRIKDILDRIHLREKLKYKDTSLEKKLVNVLGSFEEGITINSALVANTSWLRAILWSFILALREETLDALGYNPFPLVVFDDPQTTFDPRNKRKWAQEIVRLANLDANQPQHMQLIVTTHERQFYQFIVDHEKLNGEQGLIGGVNKVSGVATIVNGGCLQRVLDEAQSNNNDARARDYISDVRIYCEDLIKFMLRGEGPEIPDMTLGKLVDKLSSLQKAHTAPFDRSAFIKLINILNGGKGAYVKTMNLINDSHHKDDESIGLAEASDVKDFWKKTLQKQIHEAFHVYDKYESFHGEPRTFSWADNVIEFPSGFKDEVKKLQLQQTGIAAAAKTDGRVGDGEISVIEWKSCQQINLPNHEVYQLAAGTFDPVATIGDVVIVCNHAKINPKNLVVAKHGNTLLARRYSQPEDHSQIAILSGQSVDPYNVPEPVIVPLESIERNCKKVVGTIFASYLLPTPPKNVEAELVALENFSVLEKALKDVRLFKVEGRSAEPIALDGQYLITRDLPFDNEHLRKMDGRLVIAIDENGARYFKRLQLKKKLLLLESLNSDGTTAAEILSIDGTHGLPKLNNLLEVVGVLFELPS